MKLNGYGSSDGNIGNFKLFVNHGSGLVILPAGFIDPCGRISTRGVTVKAEVCVLFCSFPCSNPK